MSGHAWRRAFAEILGTVILVAVPAVVVLPAQAPAPAERRSAYAPPRLPDGRPSLEGVWEHNSATPLERPAQLANKPRLSDAELESLKARAAEMFNPAADAAFGDGLYLQLLAERVTPLGATGTYSANWLPDRSFEHRTSLIEDPPDGRLPTVTPEAEQRRTAALAARRRPPQAAQDLTITDRCITYGVPDLFAAYMAVYRIVQAPDVVVIQMEKIHEARVIPMDGRKHLSSPIRNYVGDARGRWDGDTLVVETTNFHPSGNPMGGGLRQSDENLRLTERFTRVADDTLRYQFTVDDPTVWTKPWTAVIFWKQAKGEVLEYACHEGNYSLPGMLAGARADEAAQR
jgi:hypothetical protein